MMKLKFDVSVNMKGSMERTTERIYFFTLNFILGLLMCAILIMKPYDNGVILYVTILTLIAMTIFSMRLIMLSKKPAPGKSEKAKAEKAEKKKK